MKNILIIFSCLIPIMIVSILYQNTLYSRKEKLYTVTEIARHRNGVRGQQLLEVTFIYNDKHYTISNVMLPNCNDKLKYGEMFLVEFLKENPSEGLILCDYNISEGVFLVEGEVWDSIPSFLKKSKE